MYFSFPYLCSLFSLDTKAHEWRRALGFFDTGLILVYWLQSFLQQQQCYKLIFSGTFLHQDVFAFLACLADGRESWVGVHCCLLTLQEWTDYHHHGDSCQHDILALISCKKGCIRWALITYKMEPWVSQRIGSPWGADTQDRLSVCSASL